MPMLAKQVAKRSKEGKIPLRSLRRTHEGVLQQFNDEGNSLRTGSFVTASVVVSDVAKAVGVKAHYHFVVIVR